MSSISNAVVINMRTLNNNMVDAMKQAMAVANKKGIPVVINTVAIKGNASEIAKTAGIDVTTKGVDSRNVP